MLASASRCCNLQTFVKCTSKSRPKLCILQSDFKKHTPKIVRYADTMYGFINLEEKLCKQGEVWCFSLLFELSRGITWTIFAQLNLISILSRVVQTTRHILPSFYPAVAAFGKWSCISKVKRTDAYWLHAWTKKFWISLGIWNMFWCHRSFRCLLSSSTLTKLLLKHISV